MHGRIFWRLSKRYQRYPKRKKHVSNDIDSSYKPTTMSSDLLTLPFADAVNYLHILQVTLLRSPKLHHMQVKAALRRCFDIPMYHSPTTSDRQARTMAEMLHHMSRYELGTMPQLFTVYQVLKYSLDILETKSLEAAENLFVKGTLGPVFLERTVEIHAEAVENLTKPKYENNPVAKELVIQILDMCERANEMYSLLFVPEYRQDKTAKMLETFKEELIRKTCHPKRVMWWMDHEEHREIFGN